MELYLFLGLLSSSLLFIVVGIDLDKVLFFWGEKVYLKLGLNCLYKEYCIR